MLVNPETGQVLPKSRRDTDTHLFNSLKESEPGIQDDSRYPKFGSIETILPDRSFWTVAVSPTGDALAAFEQNQIFWMGKKRTMFQIKMLTTVTASDIIETECQTPFLQVIPSDVVQFKAMEISAGTQRYLIMRGETINTAHWTFDFDQGNLFSQVSVPSFSIAQFLEACENV